MIATIKNSRKDRINLKTLTAGYLVHEKCSESADTFLEECKDLQECRDVLARGRRFCPKVNGYKLLDILEEFCTVSTFGKKIVELY